MKRLIIIVILLLVVLVFVNQASAESKRQLASQSSAASQMLSGTDKASPAVAPARNIASSVSSMVSSSGDALAAVGNTVVQIGNISPGWLGCLTCVLLPLAFLGIWTLKNFGAVMRAVTFHENVRSVFRD